MKRRERRPQPCHFRGRERCPTRWPPWSVMETSPEHGKGSKTTTIGECDSIGRMRRGWGFHFRHKCGRGKTRGVPAMDGGEKPVGARGHGPRGHQTSNWRYREREGSTGSLTTASNGTGTARRRRSARRGDRRSLEASGGSLGHTNARGSGEKRQLVRVGLGFSFLKR
jgi:hypothetical protein